MNPSANRKHSNIVEELFKARICFGIERLQRDDNILTLSFQQLQLNEALDTIGALIEHFSMCLGDSENNFQKVAPGGLNDFVRFEGYVASKRRRFVNDLGQTLFLIPGPEFRVCQTFQICQMSRMNSKIQKAIGICCGAGHSPQRRTR
eukprot:1395070-Amorphochlora_amoeboformis.AAC.1